MPFPVLVAALTLGKKYDIRQLHIDARRRIFETFPITLNEDEDLDLWRGVERPTAHPDFHSLLMAKRAKLLSILPRVLYDCSKHYTASQMQNGFDIGGSVGRFSIEDQITMFSSQKAMRDTAILTTYKWLFQPKHLASACETRPGCLLTRQDACRAMCGAVGLCEFAGLDSWDWPSSNLEDFGQLCTYCNAAAQVAHAAGREEFWERLPSLFNLPPWDELSKEREGLCVSITLPLLFAVSCFTGNDCKSAIIRLLSTVQKDTISFGSQ